MQSVKETFEKKASQEPSQFLRANILRNISILQEKREKNQKYFSLIIGVVSFGTFLLGITQYGISFIQSEFWTIFSLIFSDLGVLVGSFQDFLFLLLETLPLIPLIAFFLPVALFFWSMSVLLALFEKKQKHIFSRVEIA